MNIHKYNPFLLLDTLLLKKIYTPISIFAGKTYGSTNESLCKSCIAPALISGITYRIIEMPVLNFSNIDYSIIFLFLMCYGMWSTSYQANAVIKHWALSHPAARIFWLILCILPILLVYINGKITLVILFKTIVYLSWISFIYFYSVPNPPKQEQKKGLALSQRAI